MYSRRGEDYSLAPVYDKPLPLGRTLATPRTYYLKGASCIEPLAATELLINTLILRRDASLLAIFAEIVDECIIQGLYRATPRSIKIRRATRRVSGGPTTKVNGLASYVSLVVRANDLLGVLDKAKSMAECLTRARTSYGGVVVGDWGRAVYAATLIGNIGVAEVISSPQPLSRLLLCSGLRAEPLELDTGLIGMFIPRYKASTWITQYYSDRRASTLRRNKEGFELRISVETKDDYIVGWSLDSNMYASPPMEVYSILSSVKGMPFHELTLSMIKDALNTKMRVAGISMKDFLDALDSLHKAAGVKVYTT
ncbi:MAG: hypothetical protein ABWW69_07750 [Pyrodictiaceae archaeon]